jgi:hypothetical protein
MTSLTYSHGQNHNGEAKMKISLKTRDNISIENAGNALIEMLNQHLELNRWSFLPTYKRFKSVGNLGIIYDSEWCRIKFLYSRDRPDSPRYDELKIYYGRLHAPNEDSYVLWEGLKCWCWHDILNFIRFLDGLSPKEAVEEEKTHGKLPPTVNKFWESALGKRTREEFPPEFNLMLHAMLWNRYGQQLFELFDLRRPDLWVQIQRFQKEFHQLKGSTTHFNLPPQENIC